MTKTVFQNQSFAAFTDSKIVEKTDAFLDYYYTYHKTTYQLLPAPFASNCTHYPSIGYESRQDCWQKCVNDLDWKRKNEKERILDLLSIENYES